MQRDENSKGGPGGPGRDSEAELSIARSNALIPLLMIFGATVLMILVVVMRARPEAPPEGAPANRVFGPADFPQVFEEQHPLAGLDVGHGRDAEFPVPAPPFSEGVFPCSTCHEGIEVNQERRELALHTEIILRHDEQNRWCLDCHAPENRDRLRLANGSLIPFTESYRLCGQCHGTIYRDWRAGIHGKRSGYWNGAKRYLLCVHCHDPHQPAFDPLEPLPPPVRPQYLRPADRAAALASATNDAPAGQAVPRASSAEESRHEH